MQELRKGAEVAVTPDAVATVLGAQLIDILVTDKEVRDIVYFRRRKISEICTHLINLIEIFKIN